MTHFDINVSVSRFSNTYTERLSASQAVVDLITTFKESLTDFTFSSLTSLNLGELFESFPRLLTLKKFEFLVVFNIASLPHTEGLTKFIVRQSPTLETLIVKPYARQVSLDISDESYSIWLNHQHAQKADRLYSLTQITLPKLRIFDASLRHQEGMNILPLPQMSQFAPSLTKLVISKIKLSQTQLNTLLQGTCQSDGNCSLEDLSFECLTLTSSLLDTLATSLPNLKRLSIASSTLPSGNFIHEIQARRYPNWKLERIRVTVHRLCGGFHPDVVAMSQVALCFQHSVILENYSDCDCDSDD